jgi:hypothetical protein
LAKYHVFWQVRLLVWFEHAWGRVGPIMFSDNGFLSRAESSGLALAGFEKPLPSKFVSPHARRILTFGRQCRR